MASGSVCRVLGRRGGHGFWCWRCLALRVHGVMSSVDVWLKQFAQPSKSSIGIVRHAVLRLGIARHPCRTCGLPSDFSIWIGCHPFCAFGFFAIHFAHSDCLQSGLGICVARCHWVRLPSNSGIGIVRARVAYHPVGQVLGIGRQTIPMRELVGKCNAQVVWQADPMCKLVCKPSPCSNLNTVIPMFTLISIRRNGLIAKLRGGLMSVQCSGLMCIQCVAD